MMDLVLKFLFLPWFAAQKHYSLEAISVERELIFAAIFLLAIIGTRFLVRWRTKSGAWPVVLRKSIFVLYGLVDAGILGCVSNLAVEIYYNAKMPVMTEIPEMVGAQLDARHVFAEPDPLIFWLGDYLKIRDSRLLVFLFPQRECASVGDLFIAACIIFSWWAAVAISIWAVSCAAKKLLKT
jgi:hypothetical protein